MRKEKGAARWGNSEHSEHSEVSEISEVSDNSELRTL